MFGGLLAIVLVCQNPEYVKAAGSSVSLKSEGVLKFTDGSGKSVVFDSSDLYALKSAVESTQVPKLKITYHEHTDSCRKVPMWIRARISSEGGSYNYGVIDMTAQFNYVKCYKCNVEVARVKPDLTYSTDVVPAPLDAIFYKNTKDNMEALVYTRADEKHRTDCMYRSCTSTLYNCGKTTNTIESIELVTE